MFAHRWKINYNNKKQTRIIVSAFPYLEDSWSYLFGSPWGLNVSQGQFNERCNVRDEPPARRFKKLFGFRRHSASRVTGHAPALNPFRRGGMCCLWGKPIETKLITLPRSAGVKPDKYWYKTPFLASFLLICTKNLSLPDEHSGVELSATICLRVSLLSCLRLWTYTLTLSCNLSLTVLMDAYIFLDNSCIKLFLESHVTGRVQRFSMAV